MYLGGNRRWVPLEKDLDPFHDELPSSYVIHEVTVSCHNFRNTTSYNKMTEPHFKTMYNSLNFSFKDRQYRRTIIYLNLLAGKTFISNSSIFKHVKKSNHSFERRRSHSSRWGNTALWWWQFRRWGTTCRLLIMSTADNFRPANALSYLFFQICPDVRVIILSLSHFIQYS